MYRALLVGCGHNRQRKVGLEGQGLEYADCELVTLDMSPDVGADVVWDLENKPFPFDDEAFDELGAFDTIEHIGEQGDWRGWFDLMSEFHRILKPGGTFGILVPVGREFAADPGHTRMFALNYFGFLTQEFYEQNLAAGLPITDYRWYIKRWWKIEAAQDIEDHHLAVVLRKV